MIFYRGGWCPYCNTQLGEVGTIEPRLLELGFQVIAISPDLPEKLRESVEKNKMKYTMLSDSQMTAAKSFGIAFRVDDATLEKYKGYGIDLEAASGKNHHLLPVPSVFIVGTDGTIRFSYVNPDYKVRVPPDVLLAAAKAAQIHLKSVITCPNCGFQKEETMPTNVCQHFYKCSKCGQTLKPKAGDCCVFCSYGTSPCPLIQETGGKKR